MARGTAAHDHSPQDDQVALYLFLLPCWATLTSSAANLNGQLDNEKDILMEEPTDYETVKGSTGTSVKRLQQSLYRSYCMIGL